MHMHALMQACNHTHTHTHTLPKERDIGITTLIWAEKILTQLCLPEKFSHEHTGNYFHPEVGSTEFDIPNDVKINI